MWVAVPHPRLRNRPFVLAGIFSVATVVILVAYLVLAAPTVLIVGALVAATSKSDQRTELASRLWSAGLGLAVGPLAYIVLWGIVGIFWW